MKHQPPAHFERSRRKAPSRPQALATPPQIAQGTDGGIPFLAHDPVHRILYASMFSGGVARMVIR